MEKSSVLILLTLFTLLTGLAVAIYQLWSADRSKKEKEHSALAARYASKTRLYGNAGKDV